MSVGKCQGCGCKTNSGTSDWWSGPDVGTPTRCYVRWVDGKPEKGCGFEDATDYEKEVAVSIINCDTSSEGR